MKNFFKMFLAVVLGLMVTPIIIGFIFLIIGIGVLSSKDAVPKIPSESVLVLDLDCTILERVPDNPFENFNHPAFKQDKTLGLNTLSAMLKQAKNDDNIGGIYLKISNISTQSLSWATAEEIRNHLLDFKESGKFIYCYSEVLTQMSYYLATASDKIFMHPEYGVIDLRGLSVSMMFFKKMFDKIDLDMQVVKHGTYKGGAEQFVLDKMSEANKEQFQSYLNSMWKGIVSNISKSRSIDIQTVQNTCDSLLLYVNMELALERGFVDQPMYKDQFEDYLRNKLGLDSDKKINFVSTKDYRKTVSAPKIKSDKIAVIYAVGTIQDEKGGQQFIGYSTAEEIAKARKDKNVKAIVFRINSGGGSALMSDIIWREVDLTRQVKPIVVSMGDYAASGGYYIACASNYIVAQPTTLTGSIGVFGIIPNAEKMLANKLGITIDRVKTNQRSDGINALRAMDNYERIVLQKQIDKVYSIFVKRVADGRNLTTSYVDSIAEGRIWSGVDALHLNLIDILGGIDIAIKKAAELANISDYAISVRPIMKDFFTEFLESFMDNSISMKMKKSNLHQTYTYFQFIESALELKGVQTRIPYIIEVY
jgi:protease-4